jgi:lysozyme
MRDSAVTAHSFGMRNTLLLAIVLCSGCEAALDTTSSSAEQAQTVCAGPTVFGVDVSEFQGNIDWGTAAAHGVGFAMIRANDGFYDDPKFAQNFGGSAGAGVLRGAYQFFRAAEDPTNEANHFADVLMGNGGPGDLPPVADVEVSDGVDAGTYAAHLATWLAVVQQRTGVAPMIYTGKYFWQDNVGGANDTGNPLWVAQWGPSCPDIPSPWPSWLFWQTNDNGSVPGIPATVDTDLFNGDINALRALHGDPQCIANPDAGGCNGTVVTSCDSSNHLGSGDCGFFGATCSTEGGHPHCVHPYCTMNLNGAEDGSFCQGTVIDTCALGQLTSGDCGAYGAQCVESGNTAHCNDFRCWTKLNGADTGTYCEDDTKIATCTAGQFSDGDCAAYGGKCGDEGGSAHCIHFMCWSHLPAPGEDGSFCKDINTLGSCAVGAYTETDCSAQGTQCVTTAAGAQCGNGPPPSGEGEGASSGEGEGASAGGEGEGASAGGEGEGEGEGEGASSDGEGEGEGASSGGEGEGDHPVIVHPQGCSEAGASTPLALAFAGVVVRFRRTTRRR